MKKISILISLSFTIFLTNLGFSAKAQVENLKDEYSRLVTKNLEMKGQIKYKEALYKRRPISLSTEYEIVMNQVKRLESYSGTNMDIQLDGAKDADDVADHFMDTEYKGVKGLKIKLVVDKFSRETDMGAVLDDIHLLEKNTDFMASAIIKDNNNLIVKGEIYGV